jgi:antibiotic biosynthesis monooxygenase (ABM) superfamily enzyme
MSMSALPVTVAATRRARPHRAEDLERWAATLCATAGDSPGTRGCDIRRRRVRGSLELTVSVTFASAAAAHAWETSPARAALIARGDALTDGDATAALLFPAGPPPPRWRTALVVWAGLFPFALLVNVLAAAPLAGLPVGVRTLLTTALLVPLAVYVGIPAVQRLLSSRSRR